MLEHILSAGKRYIKKMDLEDMAALKICLLATGTLAGLSVTGKAARRTVGTLCGLLAAGLAIPLVASYMEELDEGGTEEQVVTFPPTEETSAEE